MKSTKLNLTAAALAVSVAMGASFATPKTAQAEVTATLGFASMYLWRGENLTPDGPQISGDLNYSHGSGFYAGVWVTNETGGHETDLYLGYGGSVGDFGYDVSYWKYLYPEDGTAVDLGDNDNSEVVLSGSYGPVTASAYINVESDTADDDYFTVDATFDKFNVLYGWWDREAAAGNDGSHITASYAFNDDVTFGVSLYDNEVPEASGNEEDPLFFASYSKSFSLK